MRVSVFAALFLTLFFNEAFAHNSRKLAATPTWKPVGALKQKTIQKSGYAIGPVIANSPDGTLYVAYISPYPQSNPNRDVPNLHIYKHDPKASSWTLLSNSPNTKGDSLGVELAVDSKGVLYMAHGRDMAGGISMYKFEGGEWKVLQEKFPSGDSPVGPFTMAVDTDGTPYISTIISEKNTGKLSLFKYDADAKEFKVVGQEGGFTPGDANYGKIAFHKNQPYVAFVDYKNDYTVSVMTFVDNEWKTVGDSIGLSKRRATWYNIAVDDKGVVYVGYGLAQDKKTGAKGVNFEVQKYENGAWSPVGQPNVAPGYAGYGAMAMNPATSTPWIVFNSYDAKNKKSPATAWKFDGTKWVAEGTVGSNISSQKYLGITVSDKPSVVFSYEGPQIESNAGIATVYSLSK